MEIIHLLLENTVPNINVIGAYLDGENKQDTTKTKRVWATLLGRIEVALNRGEEVVLMGDLNRPLQVQNPSVGTKLLYDWEKTGQVTILKNKQIHTSLTLAQAKGQPWT